MTDAIRIANRRELFWDDYLIDTGKTTAVRQLNKLQPKEVAILHDAPWEGDGCNYHCIVKDEGLYRMYYLGWEMLDPDVTQHVTGGIVVCYAESGNGKDWTKPDLGICEYGGSRDNNIILDSQTARFDNFYVFKDTNPECPDEERYKGTAIDWNAGIRDIRWMESASARGYMKVKLASADRTITSIELFGDSLDKTVVFTDGEPSSLSGEPVTMEITMSDAELFSFQFN